MRWSVRIRVLASALAILFILLFALGSVLSKRALDRQSAALEELLVRDGQTIAVAGRFVAVGADPPPGTYVSAGSDAEALLRSVGADVASPEVDVVVLRTDGTLIYVSESAAPLLPLSAPEVQDALGGRTGRSSRPSPDTGIRKRYIAIPVRDQAGTIFGVVQVAAPVAAAQGVVREVVVPIILGGFAAAGAALLLGYFLTTPWENSMRHINVVAKRLAQGQLSERIEEEVVAETTELASSLNTMAENLERQVRASYEERDTFGAVIQTMADALLVTDADGVVTMVNRAASQLFHVDQATASGATFIEVVRDHEIARTFQRARETGRQETAQVETGADLRLFRVIATPVEEKGKAAVLVIIQDLTDIQRLQDMRREFVANVSHELRTPLASITASVEALQAGAVEDHALAEDFLRRMNVEVDALTEMIQRLLELSRVETGRAEFTMRPLRLKPVVESVVDRLQPQAARRRLSLSAGLDDTLPSVLADVGAVSEVLLTLLGNAIKFTPDGGKISIAASVQSEAVQVTVRDTGSGIAAAHLPHIFERFYKVDRSRSTEGIGLGLALVKHLVQAHGGKVWAESSLGRGTAFHFTLPRADVSGERV